MLWPICSGLCASSWVVSSRESCVALVVIGSVAGTASAPHRHANDIHICTPASRTTARLASNRRHAFLCIMRAFCCRCLAGWYVIWIRIVVHVCDRAHRFTERTHQTPHEARRCRSVREYQHRHTKKEATPAGDNATTSLRISKTLARMNRCRIGGVCLIAIYTYCTTSIAIAYRVSRAHVQRTNLSSATHTLRYFVSFLVCFDVTATAAFSNAIQAAEARFCDDVKCSRCPLALLLKPLLLLLQRNKCAADAARFQAFAGVWIHYLGCLGRRDGLLCDDRNGSGSSGTMCKPGRF